MRAVLVAGFALLLLGGCNGDDEPPPVESPDLRSPRAQEIRTCLREAGFEVLGGRSSPSDRDAPDVELTTSVNGIPVFVAIYRDSAEAARREVEVRRNAEQFGGQVDRQGSVTIVWAEPPATDSQEPVERCVFA